MNVKMKNALMLKKRKKKLWFRDRKSFPFRLSPFQHLFLSFIQIAVSVAIFSVFCAKQMSFKFLFFSTNKYKNKERTKKKNEKKKVRFTWKCLLCWLIRSNYIFTFSHIFFQVFWNIRFDAQNGNGGQWMPL